MGHHVRDQGIFHKRLDFLKALWIDFWGWSDVGNHESFFCRSQLRTETFYQSDRLESKWKPAGALYFLGLSSEGTFPVHNLAVNAVRPTSLELMT